MRKIGLLCITALMGIELLGCGKSNTNKSTNSSSDHSTSKVVKHHKEPNHGQKKSSSNSSLLTSTQQTQKQQTTQEVQQGASKANGINNADDAVNAARSKYGDQNGNIHWGYMIDGQTGQPIRNADGSYFVKGTADDGTMTGTQYSINVYPDGSMTNN